MLTIGLTQNRKQQAAFGAKFKPVEYALFSKPQGSALTILKDELTNNNRKAAQETVDNAMTAIDKMKKKRAAKEKRAIGNKTLTAKLESGKGYFAMRAEYYKKEAEKLVAAFTEKYGSYVRIFPEKPSLPKKIRLRHKVRSNRATTHS